MTEGGGNDQVPWVDWKQTSGIRHRTAGIKGRAWLCETNGLIVKHQASDSRN